MGKATEIIDLSEVARRVLTENSFYEVLMTFINEHGETQSFHKAAVAERVTYSKPIVSSIITALFCTGYLDEVAQVGKSKVFALSDLGLSLIQQIISMTNQ